MVPKSEMLTRPTAYWGWVFSSERRAERVKAAKMQPIRYSVATMTQEPPEKPVGGRKRRALPSRAKSYKTRLSEAQGGVCYLCDRKCVNPTEDHVVPKALGGKNKANRLLACAKCNNRKGARPPRPCELIYLWAINLRAFHRAQPVARIPVEEGVAAPGPQGPAGAHPVGAAAGPERRLT